MATATGKAARRARGNRYAAKRAHRRARVGKTFTDNALSPEQYRAMKLSERKALKKRD